MRQCHQPRKRSRIGQVINLREDVAELFLDAQALTLARIDQLRHRRCIGVWNAIRFERESRRVARQSLLKQRRCLWCAGPIAQRPGPIPHFCSRLCRLLRTNMKYRGAANRAKPASVWLYGELQRRELRRARAVAEVNSRDRRDA